LRGLAQVVRDVTEIVRSAAQADIPGP
jgi:hypothetical protein